MGIHKTGIIFTVRYLLRNEVIFLRERFVNLKIRFEYNSKKNVKILEAVNTHPKRGGANENR